MTLPRTFKHKHSENPGGNCSDAVIRMEVCDEVPEENCQTENGSISAHVKPQNFNDDDLDEKNKSGHCCSTCFKKFTAKKNLLKHLREVHKNYSEADGMVIKKLKCPEKNCGFLCRLAREMRGHIEKSHQIIILRDTLQFSNEREFQKWKKEEESNTASWFIIGRQKTTLANGNKKQIFYCHRTGHYSPKGFGKYRMKTVGTCKIGVTCPAAMEATENVRGGIFVKYYKTHLGHEQDPMYLKLSREEECHLEEKIKQGFSFDSILEDVKESENVNEKKRRIHFLSKRDLHRIMNRTKRSTRKKRKSKESNQKASQTDEYELPVEDEQLMEITERQCETPVQPWKEVESVYPNYALYPPQPPAVSLQEPFANNQTSFNILPQQVNYGGVNIPQISTGAVTSQIVILPPNVNYGSIPEIIFFPASNGLPAEPETLLQPETLPQTETLPQPGNGSVWGAHELPQHGPELQKPDQSGPTRAAASLDRPLPEQPNSTSRGKKSKLHLQLKEKLEKVFECLPHSEHLTPRQFDLINAKLDRILAVFKLVNEKARTRKKGQRKRNSNR